MYNAVNTNIFYNMTIVITLLSFLITDKKLYHLCCDQFDIAFLNIIADLLLE